MEPPPPAPNGGVAASLAAAGIGCAAFGVAVVFSETVDTVHDALDVHSGVGPLSGKALAAIVVWGVAWTVLHLSLRRRTLSLARWLNVTVVLVSAGVVLTFPPVFTLFAE